MLNHCVHNGGILISDSGAQAPAAGAAPMLENGLYDLRYRAGEGGGVAGSGLAMLRDGRILGSDPWGGVFTGTCEFDPQASTDTVRLRFEVPPAGELITGFAAGPQGAVIDIVGAIDGKAPAPSTTVDVAGAPVSVSLTYLGPLPATAGPVLEQRRSALRRRTAARLRQ
jgi:hypothetical protein